jgi:cytochrome c553
VRNLLIIAASASVSLLLAGNAWAGGNPANGKAISEKVCGACHGVDGAKPIAPENPIIAGQYADYIVKALRDYKSGKRASVVMKPMVDPLSRKDIEDLAAWFSSQKSDLHFQR